MEKNIAVRGHNL